MTAETNTTDYKGLIGRVSAFIAVIDRYTKILQEGRDDFNVFDTLRIAGKEQCHSDIISEILNPNGRHGLSTAGLRHFIDMLKIAAGEANTIKNTGILQDWQYEGTRVDREHGGPSGRVDILLTDGSDGPNKRTIVIENKIWSGEGYEQLKRYRKDYPQALLVFLTPYGRDAASAHKDDCLSLSYQEDMEGWIRKCEKEAARYPALRESLIQYRKTIQSLTGRRINVMSNVMKEELGNIITANKESLRAAFEIKESDICGMLLEKNVIPALKEYAEKRGLLFDTKIDENWARKYDWFSFRSTEWKECRIQFEFQGSWRHSLIYGFQCGPNDTTTQKELKDAFLKIKDNLNQSSGGSAWKHNEWWPLWRDMDEEFRHWNAEHTDRWIDLYDPTTSKTLQRVEKALDELLRIVDKHNIAL